ncbi:uncharacterized protein LOC108905982 [Anoplophora glabripennis]|uniref:uncharacterized protein LOC108905982 n=1 Tax=Anoplophora glabripennis TaxID=217634 RepID=UPI0008751E0F|nr:uncharacterized protein LOC108905982 [Anoplophora glabripennis]
MNYFATNYTTEPVSTTERSFEADDSKYLIIPLVVIVLVMILSVLVYLMARRRKMNRLRNDMLKLYDFDSNEQEWECLTSSEYPCYSNGLITTNF